MKKIFVSMGVVALGAAAVHAGDVAMGMGGDTSKPWSVGVSLRGFYDDNYVTAPDAAKRDSFGLVASPYVAFKMAMDQTTLGFRYTYGATWYEDRASLDSSNNQWDQSHAFEAMLNHSFSERYSVDASDSFVIAQEPSLLNDIGNPFRTEGNNLRNHGEINFNGTLTRELSFVVGYQNTYYDYENHGDGTILDAFNPSLSGLLDRMEQEGLINLRWQALPKSVLVLGYNYKQVDYNSDELVAFTINGPQTSDVRNNRSHIVYGGIDQNFTKELFLSLRGGAQTIEYFNDPLSDNQTSPWGNITLNYNYTPNSGIHVGYTYMRNQTDVVTPDATGRITQDQQSSVVFATLHHRFTSRISGALTAQWQDGEYSGGAYDGNSDVFTDVGVSLTYHFNQYLSGDIGYDFSHLASDIPGRDYDRNRVYLGVTASY